MKTTINISDTVKIVYDGLCWQPHYFQESSLIVSGFNKGQMSKSKWVGSGSYFCELNKAVVKVAKDMVNDGTDYASLEEYVKRYLEITKELADKVPAI